MKPMIVLSKVLKACGAHFAGDAAHHATMAKAWEDDSEQQKSHCERGEACAAMAEKCNSLADKCSKAEVGDLEKLFGEDGDKLVPTNVSAITGDAPTKGKLVPRYGQREIPAENIPEQFRKLVQIEDGSEAPEAA